MKLHCISLLLLLPCVLISARSRDHSQKKYKVVCYLGSWANYRQEDGKFLAEHIDPHLCTHIIYGFAKLANDKIAVYDPYLDLKKNWGLGSYDRFNNLKKANPQLKTIIAIGGWNEGSKKYSVMASSTASRATFVQSVVDFCLQYKFDGLDMDWEYPANRGGSASDKQNFVTLLKELKTAFQPHGLLLTAAVAAGKGTIDTAYDIPQIAKYLDLINVMSYDFHGAWEKTTGHNAPLYARPEEPESNKTMNVDFAINYWIKKGAPRNKIILGMPLYGRTFTLKNPNVNGLDAPAPSPGKAGPITRQAGMLGYNEICMYTKDWKVVFAPKVDAPYAYQGNQWVGYDNEKSIEMKVNYLINHQLGGGMVWSLETDDFRAKCSKQRYPLLTTIAKKLNGYSGRQQNFDDNSAPTNSSILKSSFKPEEFKCTKEGHFKNPDDCTKFYYCTKQPADEFARLLFDCGDNMAYDEKTETCVLRRQSKSC